MDVRTIITVVSLVALVSFVLWSIGFGLTSTQSLQNQVNDLTAQRNSLQTQLTNLQNQVTSLNAQLAEKQGDIEDLEASVIVYRSEILYLLKRAYPDLTLGKQHGFLIP